MLIGEVFDDGAVSTGLTPGHQMVNCHDSGSSHYALVLDKASNPSPNRG